MVQILFQNPKSGMNMEKYLTSMGVLAFKLGINGHLYYFVSNAQFFHYFIKCVYAAFFRQHISMFYSVALKQGKNKKDTVKIENCSTFI